MTIFCEKSKKIIVIISIIAIITALVLPIIVLVSISIMFANEGEFLKEDLNNRVINENYKNWKIADVSGWEKFMIPEEWNISEESAILQITDSDGNTIAFGALIGGSEFEFSSRKEFLSSIEGVETLEVVEKYVAGFVQIRGSTFGKMIVSSDINQTVYYYITLSSLIVGDSAELLMIFPNDTTLEFESLFESAQAIVFSYGYPSDVQ